MEIQENLWWIWTAAGALISFGLWFALALKKEPRRAALGAWGLALGSAGALLGAKAFYYLCQIDFMIARGWAESLLQLNPEQLSFFGGAAGLCLGAALAARICDKRPVEVLNGFAPFGLLLGAFVRFGEYFLGMLGIGPYIYLPELCFFPLARGFSYGPDYTEWYLAVFMLEGFTLLAVAAVSGWRLKDHRFLRSVFYLCLPQILLENLRMGSFMWFFCIRVEQLACMIVLFVILVLYGVRTEGSFFRRFRPAGIALLCAGLFIVCEFAMEGKIGFLQFLTQEACYGLMALGQAVLAVTEIRAWKRVRAGAALTGSAPGIGIP